MNGIINVSKAGLNEYRSTLRANCQECFGLCCAALCFEASEDFPVCKEAGTPCINLNENYRCSIHDGLRNRGYKGCTVFDCFGAGQKVSKVIFQGKSWRASQSAGKMFSAFLVMMQLHEILWYLAEALTFEAAQNINCSIDVLLEEADNLTRSDSEALLKIDVALLITRANDLISNASLLERNNLTQRNETTQRHRRVFKRGADLIAADLRDYDLCGVSLRGAYLIAANLSGMNLHSTDFLGADFRDADIRGADLSKSIFLTQTQINSAKGDIETKIPELLARPPYWSK